VGKKGEGSVGVLDLPGTTALIRPDGIGCQRGGPNASIEVTSPCVGRHGILPMPQHRAKRRGGAAEGQAARPAFDQHRSRPLSRCQMGSRSMQEDTGGQRACPCRRIGDPNLVDRCVEPDASVRMRCTVGTCVTDALVLSDQFEHARTRCVGPLEMP
jgi:hypothetical protein